MNGFRKILIASATMMLGACASAPGEPVARLLQSGEAVALRVPAWLKHGHDMQEASCDSPPGYVLPPTYQGELLVTNERLLFANAEGVEVSIPDAAVARARPGATPLLNCLIVRDLDGHPDSFSVDAAHVRSLHLHFARALAAVGSARPPMHGISPPTATHRAR